MSVYYEYRYYIDGRKLALLQRALNTTFSDTGIITADFFVTPTADATDAVMLEYSYAPSTPTTEAETIDVSPMLALALIDYVKHRAYEDKGDEKKANEYYGKFLRRVAENETRKKGAPQRAIPGGVTALR